MYWLGNLEWTCDAIWFVYLVSSIFFIFSRVEAFTMKLENAEVIKKWLK